MTDFETRLSAAHADLDLLNSDELEAIQYLIAKLLAGKAKHGPLDLSSDGRDFLAETVEEYADAAFYVAFGAMKQRRASR